MKKCQYCSEIVPDHVTVCPNCGKTLNDVTLTDRNSTTVGATLNPSGTQVPGVGNVPPVVPPMTSGNTINRNPGATGAPNPQPMRFIIAALVVVAVALVGYFVSKSFGSSVLDVIPAESDLVITIDGEQIIKSSGCKMSGGELELSDALNKIVNKMRSDDRRLLDELKQASCFDFSQVAIVINMCADDNDPDWEESYIVLPVDDRDKAVEFFEGIHNKIRFDEEDGYMVAGRYREYIVMDEDYCWLHFGSRNVYKSSDETDGSDAVKHIEKLKKKADKESISDVSFKNDILDGGNAAAAVFDSKKLSSIVGIEWGDFLADKQYNDLVVGATLSLENAAIEASLQLFNKDGDEIKLYPWAGEINADFAKYIADKDMLVLATATDPEYKWEKLIRALEEAFRDDIPEEQRKIVLDALSSLAGTISYTVGVENLETLLKGDLSGLTFMAMIEIKDGKPKKVLDDVARQFEEIGGYSGMTVKYNGSVLECGVNGTIFKAEVKNGNIFIANRPLKEVGNNLMPASYFDGKSFAARLALAKGNQFAQMFDMPGDFIVDFSCDGEKLKARVDFSVAENAAGVLDFLFTKGQELMAPKYLKRIEEKFRMPEPDYSDSYDYYNPYATEACATDSCMVDSCVADSAADYPY